MKLNLNFKNKTILCKIKTCNKIKLYHTNKYNIKKTYLRNSIYNYYTLSGSTT